MRLFFLLCFCMTGPGFPQAIELEGQLSGWLDAGLDDSFAESGLGARYIPTFSWEHGFVKERSLDIEAALNTYSHGPLEDAFSTSELKLYRGWIRYKAPSFEVRAGLRVGVA